MTTPNDYPEHERMMQAQEASHAIGQFLEWLESGGADPDRLRRPVFLAYHPSTDPDVNDTIRRFAYNIQELLAQFFDIDLEQIQAEKDAMFADLREAQRRLFDPSLEDNTPTDAAIKAAKENA